MNPLPNPPTLFLFFLKRINPDQNTPSKKLDFPDPFLPTAKKITKNRIQISIFMRYRTRRTNDIVVGAEGRNLDAVFIATEARYYNLLDVHQGKVFICEAVRPRGGRQEGKRPIGQRVKDEITQVLYCTVVNGTVQYGSVQYCIPG